MNWHKRAFHDRQQAFQAVQTALMALKYIHPEMDPVNADFSELAAALSETGKIPAGVDPERFAAMVIFFIKNQHQIDKL